MSTNGQAKVLSHDEIARLFAAMGSPRDRALFDILLYCGLRVSEALSLRLGDIKGDMLVLPKKFTFCYSFPDFNLPRQLTRSEHENLNQPDA